jgi:hypothetical protein
MVTLLTGDRMGDEYAKCDCGGMLAMSSHVKHGERQLTEQERHDAPAGLLHRERRYCSVRMADAMGDIIFWLLLGSNLFRG